MTELAFSAYRPAEGAADELLAFFATEIATLRRRGHVTARPVPVVRTPAGEYLVVLEWSSDHAVDDAHADPEVLALWERKAQLAEYIALRDLGGTDVPFARYPVLTEL